MVDPGFSERGVHRYKISARLRAKKYFTRLALFRKTVMHHCNSYKWPHQKGGGGGMCLKCPLLDPPLAYIKELASMVHNFRL